MKKTKCAICDVFDNSNIIYHENLPKEGISSDDYASRKNYHSVHYQIVRCKTCNLVRSDPIMDSELIDNLYEKSACEYTFEKENEPLTKTYGKYLESIVNLYDVKKTSYLDIGCSNGFMLEKAIELGFSNVRGIEPGLDAIENASQKIKDKIVQGMFNSSKFQNETFDLVSFFQTFDHVIEPNDFLQDVKKILNKDGFVIAINHNINAISYKFLKEKSPIIDIGHSYLYDLDTMRKIFEKNNFEVLKVFPVKNMVTFSRLLELMPINEKLKYTLGKIQDGLGMNSFQIGLYLGNLGIFAKKND